MLKVLKYVQIHCVITVIMTIILRFIQSRQGTLWIVLAHYVHAKNLKKSKLFISESLSRQSYCYFKSLIHGGPRLGFGLYDPDIDSPISCCIL
jgi:hypothetical protein